ncbi:hypothetical protein MP638_002008 [Amoeboaphelidium occidentale]|nr:hypothetical protein MP638_002008 [Amoeboaphelidium occidentale]
MNFQLKLNRLFGFADDEIVIIPTVKIYEDWDEKNKHGFLAGIAEYGFREDKERLSDILESNAENKIAEVEGFIESCYQRYIAHGFLAGIAEYGFREDKDRLSDILESNSEEKMAEVEGFIESCYQRYIAVFHQHSGSSYRTVSSSRPSSRTNFRQDMNGEHAPEITDSQFRHSVRERDLVCLFCWNDLECHAAHIVAKKDVPILYNQRSILQGVGLQSKNQLKRYVDVVEENGNLKYVVKIVKGVRESDEADWDDAVELVRETRKVKKRRKCPDRDVESNGDFALWFMNSLEYPQNERASRSNRPAQSVDLRPNVLALQFHKAACLIWRMAGGAEYEDAGYYPEYDSDLEPEENPAANAPIVTLSKIHSVYYTNESDRDNSRVAMIFEPICVYKFVPTEEGTTIQAATTLLQKNITTDSLCSLQEAKEGTTQLVMIREVSQIEEDKDCAEPRLRAELWAQCAGDLVRDATPEQLELVKSAVSQSEIQGGDQCL